MLTRLQPHAEPHVRGFMLLTFEHEEGHALWDSYMLSSGIISSNLAVTHTTHLLDKLKTILHDMQGSTSPFGHDCFV
jgi:hypothetical protein